MAELWTGQNIGLSLPTLFPRYNDLLSNFLEKNKGVAVNKKSDEKEVKNLAGQLVGLMSYLATEIAKWPPRELFRQVILSNGASRLVHRHENGEELRYHVFHRTPQEDNLPRDLLILNQRVPSGVDTLEEVHEQGMEIYLPLTEGTVFYVNDQVIDPKPLEKLVLVLPGDVHRHVKDKGRKGIEPARVLIAGAFGFSRGEKVPPYYENSNRFTSINRIIRIK